MAVADEDVVLKPWDVCHGYGESTEPQSVAGAAVRFYLLDDEACIGDPPSDSMELIGLNAVDPQWESVGPMLSPRRHHNATVLPDGTVLVTGGTSGAGFSCGMGASLAAELWNPETEAWTSLAPMAVKRLYHSTAVLLPDGRVLSAGGGNPAASTEVNHHNTEIFSPPYLFSGPRPTIAATATDLDYGGSFFVATPEATSIAAVNLIRLPAVTHVTNAVSSRYARRSVGCKDSRPGSAHEAHLRRRLRVRRHLGLVPHRSLNGGALRPRAPFASEALLLLWPRYRNVTDDISGPVAPYGPQLPPRGASEEADRRVARVSRA